MLQVNFLRENKERVLQGLQKRNFKQLELVEEAISTDDERKNIHIPRQSLRMQLLNQLTDSNSVKWGHQLTSINELDNNEINLTHNFLR